MMPHDSVFLVAAIAAVALLLYNPLDQYHEKISKETSNHRFYTHPDTKLGDKVSIDQHDDEDASYESGTVEEV